MKQLQKEVARLEAELKLPEGATDYSTSEALLQAKDLQIQKVKKFASPYYIVSHYEVMPSISVVNFTN